MRPIVAWYRWMAYITGVVLIILCVLAVLQLTHSKAATEGVHVLGLVHGMLYIVYLLAGYTLSRRLRLRPVPTVAVLLAGTVPVMTFLVERHISQAYIAPALAAQQPAAATGAPAPAGADPAR